MPSRTEQALIALVAAIEAARAANQNKLPPVFRNETLPARLDVFTDNVGGFLNILDGNGGPEGADGSSGETLGADQTENGYELVQRPEIEWIVESQDRSERDGKFDQGLSLINEALKADRTLGGVVDDARIEKIERSHLAIDGLANLKGAIITIALTFLSSEPF